MAAIERTPVEGQDVKNTGQEGMLIMSERRSNLTIT